MTIRADLGLTARRRGRPASRDWAGVEKPIIESLLRAGYGIRAIARFYNISPSHALHILRKLGLRTQWQEEKVVPCTTTSTA